MTCENVGGEFHRHLSWEVIDVVGASLILASFDVHAKLGVRSGMVRKQVEEEYFVVYGAVVIGVGIERSAHGDGIKRPVPVEGEVHLHHRCVGVFLAAWRMVEVEL